MRWPCWIVGHTPLLTRRRDTPGPQALVWVCRHCLKDLGETAIVLDGDIQQGPPEARIRPPSRSR